MMLKTSMFAWMTLAAGLLWGMAAQATDPSDLRPPEQIIEGVFSDAVDALVENQDAIRDRPRVAFELIDDILSPHVHYPLMGQLILTSEWRTASEAQRQEFLDTFREYIIRTYSKLLSDNVDEVVRVVQQSGTIMAVRSVTEPDQRGRVTVRTQFLLESGNVPVQYRMIATDNGWRVWDVVIESISFVTNYRDEFGSEMRRHGLDGLIERLKERNARAWESQS
ncbi:phospholipid transport system substrate-binding protein [Natronocella acetinitrilica]|uniref:Phospholipid transport system substrate-binding protein n=1 Tax=Natronocella acetinitrilica TaxID=414046 RepID=A0AAE3G0J1_9GAMM|nr:ABC transporter substrate-binding protein [Natronocella acetinitrilica]MCP1673134.1 phospholipid transport system substrate-binding protein [Natronocella acetinitrilica]